ncbi:MAG: SusC/RagA family TonB-linked outer membrane protein [Bacteroidetes bacterium]|nr:SusC/RagA family TonB-linked outer membrane protein [Bacteroidota bacterium]MDA1120319.1 SusC/RagA family TonB-linked outer membrane protein [Bacteroidota bacterium]
MKKNYFQFLTSLVLCLSLSLSSFAQERSVTGKVAENGESLPGVNVLIEGTSTGTVTDFDGNYRINVSGDNATLTFSYIGYNTETVAVGNRSVVDMALTPDVTQLQEVVVTALGVERNVRALSGAIGQVGGEELTQARENNIGNQLSGRVAGVNVSNMATGPAGSTRIVIRGNKTLGGSNQPLYVIDGIPLDNTNYGQAGLWGGADEGDGLTSINPNDIESITVLKGAAAAALYGSRGGFGVINIVTKKGGNKKGLGIEFNSNVTFEKVIDLSDKQKKFGDGAYQSPGKDANGDPLPGLPQRPRTQQEAYNWGAQGWGEPLGGSSINFDGVTRPYTDAGDNWSRFYKTAAAITNSVSVTGGSATQQIRFSVADLRSDGIMPNSGFDRTNLTLSTNSKFGDKITLNSKIMYSHEDVKNRPRVSDSPANAFLSVWRTPANLDVRNYKGDPDKLGAVPTEASGLPGSDPASLAIYGKVAGEEFQQQNNNWGQNPYWVAYQLKNSDVRDRVLTSTTLRYDILDFLYIQGRVGLDWYTRNETGLTPQGTGYQRGGSMQEGQRQAKEINMEWMLGFDKTFDKVSVNTFVGGNRMRRDSESVQANGNGFNVPFFAAINNAAQRNYSYGFREEGINSIFASAEVGYNGIIFLTATGRNDWFSVLNNDADNDIFYPSVGASFVFSDAFEMPSAISFGKLRASWGQVGLAGIGPYSVNTTYSLNNPHRGRAMATYSGGGGRFQTLRNPELIPSLSTEIEFGFDLRLFNNRAGIDFAYYSQTTTEDIVGASVALSSAFSKTTVNVGKLENKGVELLLTGTPIQSGDLTWDVSLNLAKNKNKVIRIIEGLDELVFEESRTRTTRIKHIVGQPFGMITGFRQKTDPSGNLVFDANGRAIASNGYEILGNGLADWTGGLNNSVSYKGLNLSFLIDFKIGGDVHSGSNMRLAGFGYHKQTLQGRPGEEALTVEGVTETSPGVFEPLNLTLDPNQAKNYWTSLGGRAGENYMYSSGFGKLRQITLGYTLPRSIIEKTPFTSITLSAVGRNLAILWSDIPNVDPESQYSANSGAQGLEYFAVPTSRSYGFNLRIVY